MLYAFFFFTQIKYALKTCGLLRWVILFLFLFCNDVYTSISVVCKWFSRVAAERIYTYNLKYGPINLETRANDYYKKNNYFTLVNTSRVRAYVLDVVFYYYLCPPPPIFPKSQWIKTITTKIMKFDTQCDELGIQTQ